METLRNYASILFVILEQSALVLMTRNAQDNLFVLNEGDNYMMRDGGYWGLGGGRVQEGQSLY
jgi:hypothetical protein